jgi:flagellar biosynthesis component FlhA
LLRGVVSTALLKERISIRNVPFILENILTFHESVLHTNELIHLVRKALIPTLLEQAKHHDGTLHYVDVEHSTPDKSFLSFIEETFSRADVSGVQPIFLLNDSETYNKLFDYLHQRQIYAILVDRNHLPFNVSLQKLEIFAK